MKLQTKIQLSKSDHPIDYHSQLLLLGSCFVENIGQKLAYFKFQSLQNPFGILFHPKAIENLVIKAIKGKNYKETDIFFYNERWHCFDAHSSLSDISKENLLRNLNDGFEQTHQQLIKSTHVIITLGTAWVYRFKKTNSLVVNCHKVPQKEFSKELLSVKEISESLKSIITHIQSINKDISVIFTISPVRHLREGFSENLRSKAHLITAMHDVIYENKEKPPHSRLEGFPSYEIMMDELRDYRFYEADMVHPNALAVDYIWEKFKDSWISDKAYPIMDQVDSIQKGLRHKPFNPDGEQHRDFVKLLQGKIVYLQKAYPFIRFGGKNQDSRAKTKKNSKRTGL